MEEARERREQAQQRKKGWYGWNAIIRNRKKEKRGGKHTRRWNNRSWWRAMEEGERRRNQRKEMGAWKMRYGGGEQDKRGRTRTTGDRGKNGRAIRHATSRGLYNPNMSPAGDSGSHPPTGAPGWPGMDEGAKAARGDLQEWARQEQTAGRGEEGETPEWWTVEVPRNVAREQGWWALDEGEGAPPAQVVMKRVGRETAARWEIWLIIKTSAVMKSMAREIVEREERVGMSKGLFAARKFTGQLKPSKKRKSQCNTRGEAIGTYAGEVIAHVDTEEEAIRAARGQGPARQRYLLVRKARRGKGYEVINGEAMKAPYLQRANHCADKGTGGDERYQMWTWTTAPTNNRKRATPNAWMAPLTGTLTAKLSMPPLDVREAEWKLQTKAEIIWNYKMGYWKTWGAEGEEAENGNEVGEEEPEGNGEGEGSAGREREAGAGDSDRRVGHEEEDQGWEHDTEGGGTANETDRGWPEGWVRRLIYTGRKQGESEDEGSLGEEGDSAEGEDPDREQEYGAGGEAGRNRPKEDGATCSPTSTGEEGNRGGNQRHKRHRTTGNPPWTMEEGGDRSVREQRNEEEEPEEEDEFEEQEHNDRGRGCSSQGLKRYRATCYPPSTRKEGHNSSAQRRNREEEETGEVRGGNEPLGHPNQKQSCGAGGGAGRDTLQADLAICLPTCTGDAENDNNDQEYARGRETSNPHWTAAEDGSWSDQEQKREEEESEEESEREYTTRGLGRSEQGLRQYRAICNPPHTEGEGDGSGDDRQYSDREGTGEESGDDERRHHHREQRCGAGGEAGKESPQEATATCFPPRTAAEDEGDASQGHTRYGATGHRGTGKRKEERAHQKRTGGGRHMS